MQWGQRAGVVWEHSGQRAGSVAGQSWEHRACVWEVCGPSSRECRGSGAIEPASIRTIESVIAMGAWETVEPSSQYCGDRASESVVRAGSNRAIEPGREEVGPSS